MENIDSRDCQSMVGQPAVIKSPELWHSYFIQSEDNWAMHKIGQVVYLAGEIPTGAGCGCRAWDVFPLKERIGLAECQLYTD